MSGVYLTCITAIKSSVKINQHTTASVGSAKCVCLVIVQCATIENFKLTNTS